MKGEYMRAEIREQPAVLRRILAEGREGIQVVAERIRSRGPRFVLLVARGTSDHAALYAKYLIETRLRLPTGLVSPSTVTVYGTQPRSARDLLVLAVSQSGASPDIVEPVARWREAGALTVAVTNAGGSPLAHAADHCLDVLAGPERAVAATKTYTAELLTLYLLVAALEGVSGDATRGVPEVAEDILSREDQVEAVAQRYRFAEQVVVTSRGYNYPTARETGLKLMETSYLVAHAFSGADLLHGPMAMVRRGFPVIAIVPRGAGGRALTPVLQRLHQQRADILIVGVLDEIPGAAARIEADARVDEALSPMLLILPMQQLAWHLARQRGEDPDHPEGLEKVTETW